MEKSEAIKRAAGELWEGPDAVPLREVSESDPRNFEALHFSGLLALQRGKSELAAEFLEKALLCTKSPVVFNDLGRAYRCLGLLEEAERSFREACALNPDFVTALNNLGAVLQESRRPGEAERVLRKAVALAPDFVEAYGNLGNVLQDQGRFEEAASACRRALAMNPGIAAPYNILGNALKGAGRLEEAEKAYREALSLQPGVAVVHNNLGTVLFAQGRVPEAEQALRQALSLNPELAMAYGNLGTVLRAAGRYDESRQAGERAIALSPEGAEGYDNLGVTLTESGDLEGAKRAFQAALSLNPESAGTYSNLGVACKDLGLYEEAEAAFRQALSLSPESGVAAWNLGWLDLLKGNLAAGWRGYQWRLTTQGDPHGTLPLPCYDGSPLAGKTLFVYGEQAVGEEIMFSSCLSWATAQADHCILECDPRLVPLFSRSFPAISVIPAAPKGSVRFPQQLMEPDFRLPLGSLPRYCRNSLSEFAVSGPWLIPSPAGVARWHSRYDLLGSGLKVGIAWRGGVKVQRSRVRSTTLFQWKELFSIPGLNLVNLQYGDCVAEIEELQRESGVRIHGWQDADQLRDLDDFAAQVAALDLVISIDNSTAHMAGALGRPVWCLLPYVPNWRWMLERDDSPWYPTMQLFRQEKPDDWEAVFRAVARQLRLQLGHHRLESDTQN